MKEKKTYITINPSATIHGDIRDYEKSLNELGFNEAFVFVEYPLDTLLVNYAIRKNGRIELVDSPVEEQVPCGLEVYRDKKHYSKNTDFNINKLEAILKISPVGIIVPSKKWAKKLEDKIKDLRYDFKRVSYWRLF